MLYLALIKIITIVKLVCHFAHINAITIINLPLFMHRILQFKELPCFNSFNEYNLRNYAEFTFLVIFMFVHSQ
jgi:hypothetical protein